MRNGQIFLKTFSLFNDDLQKATTFSQIQIQNTANYRYQCWCLHPPQKECTMQIQGYSFQSWHFARKSMNAGKGLFVSLLIYVLPVRLTAFTKLVWLAAEGSLVDLSLRSPEKHKKYIYFGPNVSLRIFIAPTIPRWALGRGTYLSPKLRNFFYISLPYGSLLNGVTFFTCGF